MKIRCNLVPQKVVNTCRIVMVKVTFLITDTPIKKRNDA